MKKTKKSVLLFRDKQRKKAIGLGWKGIPRGKSLPRGWM